MTKHDISAMLAYLRVHHRITDDCEQRFPLVSHRVEKKGSLFNSRRVWLYHLFVIVL